MIDPAAWYFLAACAVLVIGWRIVLFIDNEVRVYREAKHGGTVDFTKARRK